MLNNQFVEILFEKAQEKLATLASKDSHYILFIVPQMVQDVSEHGTGIVTGQRKIMSFFRIKALGKNMAEKVGAHFLEQIILCFKMGVKCAAPDIRFVNDLLYGDFGIAF